LRGRGFAILDAIMAVPSPAQVATCRRFPEALVLSSLLVALVVVGFVLFPGCSQCCRPTPSAAAVATAPAPVGATIGATSPAPAVIGGGPVAIKEAAPIAVPPIDRTAAARVHNYFRLSPRLASGAAPENDADFEALAAAGIKSIVTVDGARPDADGARAHGIRYVHVPIGYDGISTARALELTKTFQELAPAGPIFVHCHHGKHRGPAACGIARIILDGITPQAAVEEMKRAGTDPKYKGLYASVLAFHAPTADELAAVKADLPEAAALPARAETMVAIDQLWDRMKAVRAAKWTVPADHPDVDPPHEATILMEQFRELARRPETAAEDDDFRTHLAESEAAAAALATALAPGKLDADGAAKAFDRSVASCAACHATHRDTKSR
jgi:protein tyrosine phosphatase (PTP) superfamily phosphohydrolase (DUF442 family)